MNPELGELHLPGGYGASLSRPTEPPARLAARGHTSPWKGVHGDD
jgi:hypothetical protein